MTITTQFATSVRDEPQVLFPWSYYDNGRTKEARWEVAEQDGQTLLVDLQVTHDKDRKRFVARLGRAVAGDGFTKKTFVLFQQARHDDVQIITEPVARYNAKARDAFFDLALAAVRALAEDDQVARFFEQTEGWADR